MAGASKAVHDIARMMREQKERRAAERAEAQRKEQSAPANDTPAENAGLGPTPEQKERYNFKFENIRAGTVRKGAAYRRQPYFETLHARGDIDSDQVEALRYYRNAYEAADRSETRCALNREPGGGTSEAVAIRLLMARETRDDCEAAIPAFLLDTLRSVAINDMDFSEVARERFGAKEGKDEKGVWVLLPPNSRQRSRIATEFKTAAYALHTFVAPRIQTT